MKFTSCGIKKTQKEDWGFLFIESLNTFNEYNGTKMLWGVRYECPSRAQFTFNCYHHCTTLVVCDTGGLGHFLNRK